ncbi:thiamine phosphate synthase [Variovorax sp. J22P168]|uniref:thiamine phosphate synthase n=1 Tax=Variovorax jilinensis TaxID=3053513 RepID=UPI002575F03C|nr:thiamine phosphate synthase [Variovorax sp. J22P168]MDM0013438.1 thiamine phosphate synthase [Variovorax sp. J22P168]
MNTATLDSGAIATAIVEVHASRFGQVSDARVSFDGNDDPLHRGVKQGCAALGFIDIDAECLARAWCAQTERTGGFDARAWPANPVDFGLRPFPPTAREDAFPRCPTALGLYAVLPDAQWVGRMAGAGVPTVQLRFKSDDAQAIEREVVAAVEAVRGTDSLLFINDHWQQAIDAGAYGLHLGQEDLDALSPAQLQAIRASGMRLGVSTHGYAEMLRADRASPSYIAMGAVYPTTLKRMATAPQGVARLAAYAKLMHGYPQVGIGGIDEQRMPEVAATGVGSIAVVRAIVSDPDPEAAAARLMAICGR